MKALDARIAKFEAPLRDDLGAVCVFVEHPPTESQSQAIAQAQQDGRQVIRLSWLDAAA
jgi:hypothetical protein